MIQRCSLRGLAAAVLLFVASASGLQAQSTEQGDASEESRPRIALALSGGGALGMAHVGVLGVLEELHVPIDCIAGTSMGALVGGLYATGIPAAGLQGLIDAQDWADVFSDRTAYRDLPFRRKEDERRYLVDLQLGLSQEGVALPSGLVTGQKLFFLLQRYALPVVEINDFTQLPIPFVTVATDLATGQPVVLRSGDLASALRASMSIPGFFSPLELEVEFEGRREKRLLVDGGVVNNLPVQLAKQLCDADVVIAVDVTQPLASRDELQTQADITSQTLAFLTRIEVDRQLEHADIVISPELEEFGLFSFQDAAPIVAAGAAGARAQVDALAALGLDETDYLHHRASQQHPPPPRIVPAYIRFDGSGRVDERTLRRQVRTRVAEPVDLDILREDLGRLYNLNDFERVTFRLEEDNGEVGLVFQLEDKSLGQTYLQFGVELTSDLRGETGFTALINATRTRLNRYGAEWRSDLTLGDVHGLFSELYLPLGYAASFFVSPWVEIQQRLSPVFDGGRRIAEYDLETHFAGFDLGLRLGRVGEVRAGVIRGKAKADAVTGAVDLPEFDIDVGGVRLIAIVDDADRPTWAREGWSLVGSYFNSLTELGASDAYERLEAYAAGFASHGDHTFGLIGGAGTDFDTGAPVYDNFSAGGAGSFVGLTQEQLSGPAFAKARFLYYYQFMTLSPTVGRGVFAGLVLDAGNYWQSLDAATLDDLRYGTGIFVGADTFLGPVLVGYGRTDDGQDEFYFTIGQQLSR